MENQGFQQTPEDILEAYAETIRAPLMLEIEQLADFVEIIKNKVASE